MTVRIYGWAVAVLRNRGEAAMAVTAVLLLVAIAMMKPEATRA